jgi:hypothetical protein
MKGEPRPQLQSLKISGMSVEPFQRGTGIDVSPSQNEIDRFRTRTLAHALFRVAAVQRCDISLMCVYGASEGNQG